MGYKQALFKERFIPVRFLSLTIQVILTILVFNNLDLHTNKTYSGRNQSIKDLTRKELIIALSLSLIFNSFEYLGMFSGISTFVISQVVTSSMCHCAGSLIALLFNVETWSSKYFWFVVGFCSLIPFVSECYIWLRVLVFHKNAYFLTK